VKISVTQEHIDAGERQDCGRCPVALAFAVAGFNVSVCPVYVEFYTGPLTRPDFLCRRNLPHEAGLFIYRFDKEGPSAVAPFEFEMPDLDNLQSAIGDQQFASVPVV
jgi:hypothetical protein